jgi:glycosyltransferase involved in cell wall biosynthesis
MTSNSNTRKRLLIISQDIVDHKMAGPGIRYLEMARALSTDLDVTLAVPGETSLQVSGLHIQTYRFDQPAAMRELVEQSDILLISSFILEKFPFLEDLPRRQNFQLRVVVDLYDPLVLENLHIYQNEPLEAQQSLNLQAVQAMNRLVRLGDFFICGNSRQRDFWIGVLAANGRINPLSFANDATLRNLIDVVGVGFPDRQPVQRSLLRGIHPAVPADAQIVLWGGGIWDWLDPLSLVRAWPQVLARHPLARLIFLGTRHPNPLVPPHKMAEQTETLAADLGEKDRTILFFEWLPYADFEALLGEADVGVALHPLHVETHYSIRTRVLDYLWAQLPVLVTEGDVTSEWVQGYSLGQVVPPLDVDAIAKALINLLDKPKASWQPAYASLAHIFAWSHVIQPLSRYCLQGVPAPDLASGHFRSPAGYASSTFNQSLRQRIARARYIWRTEGFRMLLHRAWRYAKWKLSQ